MPPNPRVAGINLFNQDRLRGIVERRRARGLPRDEAVALMKRDFDAFREAIKPRSPTGPEGLEGYVKDVVNLSGDLVQPLGGVIGSVIGESALRLARAEKFGEVVGALREQGFSPSKAAKIAAKNMDELPITTPKGAELNQSFKEAIKLDRSVNDAFDAHLDTLSMREVIPDPVTGVSPVKATREQRRLIAGKTGWWKGWDDRWRYEISDVDFKVKDDFGGALTGKHYRESVGSDKRYTPLELIQQGFATPETQHRWVIGNLSDVVEHEDLFKYYPALKDVKIYWSPDLGPARAQVLPTSVKNQRKTPEIELNLMQYGHFVDRATGRITEEGADTILHEMQHIIQEYEDFAIGGAPENAWKAYKKGLKQRVEILKQDLNNVPMDNVPMAQELRRQLKLQRDLIKDMDTATDQMKTEWYFRLAGETEARAVASRRYFTQRELQQEPLLDYYNDVEDLYPQLMEDIISGRVPEHRQILRFK